MAHNIEITRIEVTDYLRVNPTCDTGITGAMKVAHAAEGFRLDVEIHAPDKDCTLDTCMNIYS